LGPNVIQARGTDRAGNSVTTTVTVTRQTITQPTLRVVSGNGQSAVIGTPLPAPLVAQLVNGSGVPMPNVPVVFRVTSQDGLVKNGTGTGLSSLAINTNAQGQAVVNFVLGSRVGAGNNKVEASTAGVATTAVFSESATPTTPGLIVIDSGNNQTGVIT